MSYFLTLGLILFLYMSLWFVISVFKKRNDVADIAWGLGFVVLSWAGFFLEGNADIRHILVNLLVSIWGIRLASHIYFRILGKPEDFRYAKWRAEWGKWFYMRSYLQVYLLQGALLFFIILPVLLIQKSPSSAFGWLDLLGICVWSTGFIFEVVGDSQLKKFVQNPANKGKILQTGLWALSRHPNYFGEVAQWWGLWILALSAPFGWVGVLGPVTITFLILKVSGVPLLEKKMSENPDFENYKQKVSMFFPWFSKL